MTGEKIYNLMKRLFPICRSITGDGVRKTLDIISEEIPLKTYEIPTGTQAFDWTVPMEWNINDAYVENENGEKIIDFKVHNLHIMGYSVPIDKWVNLDELQEHLFSLEEQPNAIPYVTSYYKEDWGFCIEHSKRLQLKQGTYHVVIDSSLKAGTLTYGELIIPGECDKEIFLSTYICHPSMANNELSGPVMVIELAKWLLSKPRKYTYRIIFIPETIGSIIYLSKNIEIMKNNIIAGFNLTCVGDDGPFSYLPSRNGNTLADRVVRNILKFRHPDYIKYSSLDRGSDERQYCSPGVDLPVVTIMRSKYGEYPEYHTSLDNLDFVSSEGLQGSFEIYKECIKALEFNDIYISTCICEPQLGKRSLYPSISIKGSARVVRDMTDVLFYADGKNDLIDISKIIKRPLNTVMSVVKELKDHELLKLKSANK